MLFFRKLDFAGIIIGLMGSSTGPFYYGFYCKEMKFYYNLWITLVWSTCIIGFFIIMSPSLIKGFGKNWIVAAVMIVAGYSNTPGYFHMWFFIESKYLPVCPKLQFFVAGLLCAIGGVIYSLKIPERFFKGEFDFIGNSHNIFHCMVILAALIWF